MGKEYIIEVGASSSLQYLTEVHEGALYSNNIPIVKLHKIVSCRSEWGSEVNRLYTDNEFSEMPENMELTYLSYSEYKFYSVKASLAQKTIEEFCNKYGTDVKLLIGMAPLGNVAIWVHNPGKSIIVNWLKGEEVNVSMNEFLPLDPDLNISEYCEAYNKHVFSEEQEYIQRRKPQPQLFNKYMQQFTYRYLTLFEKWEKDKEIWQKYGEEEVAPELDYIEEALFDGTHDKLHDGGLMKYHQAGKPKKLAVQWYIKKWEYSAYFWFEDERIRDVFDRFYGAHPDTRTDFIIRIDAEKRKYELALYRYGLKEPQVIPEDVYQLLVFKNKFEDYRSENYNQKRGAWIW